jgi:hypothetical protein
MPPRMRCGGPAARSHLPPSTGSFTASEGDFGGVGPEGARPGWPQQSLSPPISALREVSRPESTLGLRTDAEG